MNGDVVNAKQYRSPAKRWVFRVLAVLLGLSPFMFLEATLRSIDWQPAVKLNDPFLDFQSVGPLFVADEHHQNLVTAANRLEYFQPESFAIHKQPNDFRIVCIGGSTVQGRPYGIETSFTTWLELSLQAMDSSHDWDVINCGGVSYASYRLVSIATEMLCYQPDLMVLYTGHNEFLEDRNYFVPKQAPALVSQAFGQLSRLKSFQCLHQAIVDQTVPDDIEKGRPILTSEVDALLDYQGGLESYHRDADWRREMIQQFECNLRQIIELANRAQVPIVLIDPPVNLRDCPPFKNQSTDGLAEHELVKVQQLVSRASQVALSQPIRAIKLLQQAVAIDPHHAGNHFQLATLYAQQKRYDDAKHHFEVALDEDVCPLRIIQPLSQVIHSMAADTNTPLVQARTEFENLSEGTIPGNNLFCDHVHPSFLGHQVIAEKIAKELWERHIVMPEQSWEATRDELYKQHWESLDPVYFERGKQRLQGLKIWTEGRCPKLREPTTQK